MNSSTLSNQQFINNHEEQQHSFIQSQSQQSIIKYHQSNNKNHQITYQQTSTKSTKQNIQKFKKQQNPNFINIKYLIFFILIIVIISFTYFYFQQNKYYIDDDQDNLADKKSKQKQQEQDFTIQIEQKPIQYHQTSINPLLTINEPDSPNTDKYFFSVSVADMIKLSNLPSNFQKGKKISVGGLTLDRMQLAVKLLQVVHNVDIQAKIKIEMANHDKDGIDAKKSRIIQLLQEEEKYYHKRYQIRDYIHQQLPFCIVVPSYNNVKSRLFLRNLDSIFMQNYDNFHVVYIDDASPQKTGQFVQQYMKERSISDEFIKVIINQKNNLALNNIYDAIHNHCSPGQIVALVDGDDALIGRQVLATYNAIYQKTKCALAYSNYLHIMNNKIVLIGSSSRSIPLEYLMTEELFRKKRDFFTSHLLTFYVDLFKMIKKEDLTYENGTFYKASYDVAICTPMIQMARKRIFYLPQLTYEYRYDTGQNDQIGPQQQVTSIIYGKPPYKEVKQFAYIDNRKEYLKNFK